MEEVLKNADLSVLIVSFLLGSCSGDTRMTIEPIEPSPGYFERFGLKAHMDRNGGILDNGETCVIRHGRRAQRLRLVCRQWRNAVDEVVVRRNRCSLPDPRLPTISSAADGHVIPYFCREEHALRKRIESRLARRRVARNRLTDRGRALLDEELGTVLTNSFIPQDTMDIKLGADIVHTILELLERGASTERFEVWQHDYGDYLFDNCFSWSYRNFCWIGSHDEWEKYHWVAAMALLQEVACAAGQARPVVFHNSDGSPIFILVIHLIRYGDIQCPFLKEEKSTISRRLMLGLARVLMNVSSMDLVYVNSIRRLNEERPLKTMMFDPLVSREDFWSWTRVWNDSVCCFCFTCRHECLPQNRLSFPRSEQDRCFIADFLASVSANGLGGHIDDIHFTKLLGSFNLEVELALNLYGEETLVMNALTEKDDPSYLNGTVRSHFRRHFMSKEARSNLTLFFQHSQRNRKLFIVAYGGYLVKELVRMKQRKALNVLVKMEPIAMARMAPALLDYVNSKAVCGRKERIQDILHQVLREV